MRRATLLTLASAVLWGTSFPAIRAGLDAGGAGPTTFVFVRFALAALVALGVAAATRRLDLGLLASPALWGLALLNATGYAFQFLAQDLTTASKTSLLVDINVVPIAILGFFFLGERHGKEVVAALLLGVAGVFLLSTGGDLAAATFRRAEFLGDALAFAAGLVWSASFVATKAYLDRRPTIAPAALTFALLAPVALFLLPLAWATEGLRATGTPLAWGLAAYLAVFATVLAFLCWLSALRTESVTVTSILLLLEIAVAVGISVALLDERLTGWALVGALLVAGAASLAARGPEPRTGRGALPAPPPA